MCIRIEKGIASAASETIDVPSLTSFKGLAAVDKEKGEIETTTYRAQRLSLPPKSRRLLVSRHRLDNYLLHTSPQPIHGKGVSSCSIGDSG